MKLSLNNIFNRKTLSVVLLSLTCTVLSTSNASAQEKRDLTKYPCFSYTEACGKMPPPPIEKVEWSGKMGDVALGKTLAFTSSKGNCLACHAINGGSQGGSIGPSLMDYGSRGLPEVYTYQRIHDTRLYNPDAHMPIFGVTGLLNDEEIRHIMAFLHSLKSGK